MWGEDKAIAERLSAILDEPVSFSEKIYDSWRHTVMVGGRSVATHASHEDELPDWNDGLRIAHGPRPTQSPGESRIVAAAFGVSRDVVDPYLIHLTRSEVAASYLLRVRKLTAPLNPGDLRGVLDPMLVMDLVEKLGAGAINRVLRDSEVTPVFSLNALRPK